MVLDTDAYIRIGHDGHSASCRAQGCTIDRSLDSQVVHMSQRVLASRRASVVKETHCSISERISFKVVYHQESIRKQK